MEEMQQITIDQWMSWKEDIRRKLAETARNFVYIGCRLKQIRDSGMYDGAEDIFEFAMNEYGLSKSTVSRFIAINERFSEGGNSLELKAEYREMGSSKLGEMLALTDAECSMITKKTTVVQIRELKEFNRQEPEEEKGQEEGEDGRNAWTPVQKCIIEYFRGKKEMLDAAMGWIAAGDNKKAAEIISPNGSTTFKKGIIFLFMYDYETGVKYKTFGTNDITVMSWDDFLMDISEIFWPDYSMGINGYDAFYKEPEQKTEKVEEMPQILNGEGSVATSQQEKKEDKNHVEKMEDEAMSESGTEEDDGASEESAGAAEPKDDEDGAGGEIEDSDVVFMGNGSLAENQTPIELYGEGEFEDKTVDTNEKMSDSGKGEQIRGYKAEIKADLEIMDYQYEKQDWDGIIKSAENVIWRAKQIQKIQKEEECK